MSKAIDANNKDPIVCTSVCAWDVGIKNLAYCVITKKADGTFDVDKTKWNKINLMEEEKKEFNCSHITTIKKKKEDIIKACPRKATCYYLKDEIKYGLCGVHQKSYNVPEEDNLEDQFISSKKKEKCNHLNKNRGVCGKNSLWEYDNKFYCTPHKKSEIAAQKKINVITKR